ncbi:MAG: hypothetical protein II411_05815 [Lachnospiraceae bacterium]|nr:hypothetical protein [Lachnospiraceae bacterium]
MIKSIRIILMTLMFFSVVSFNSFATNVVVQVDVPDGTIIDNANSNSEIPRLIACEGGTSVTTNPEDYEYEMPYIEEEETYTMPQTTAIWTSEEDPLFVVEVDGEGNRKEIHLPYPDATIDYDKVNYKKAKYQYTNNELIIKYGNDTYVVGGKDASGFYTKVRENGREYSIDRYQKIAGIDNYLYKGKEYEVDENGFMVGYRKEWVESNYRDYNGEKIGNYEDTKLLFKKEVPFNILWKNRPLSEEEQELLTTGPGVGLASFSTGVSDDGTAKVIVNRKPEELSVADSGVDYVKKKVVVDDPLDPMKAKSTKKKKD